MMKCKGYLGSVAYDDEAEIFYVYVLGIKDVITFQGRSVDKIKQAFRDSVNVSYNKIYSFRSLLLGLRF